MKIKNEAGIKAVPKEMQDSEKMHQCDVCSKTFPTKKVYHAHIREHHSKRKSEILFTENEDKKRKTQNDELQENSILDGIQTDITKTGSIKIKKEGKNPKCVSGQKQQDKIYICPGCPPHRPLKFNHLKPYREHYKTHQTTDYFVEKVKVENLNNNADQLVMQAKDATLHNCNFCSKSFSTFKKYKTHFRRVHSSRNVESDENEKQVALIVKSPLQIKNINTKEINEKQTCNLCSKSFVTIKGYKIHFTRQHGDMKIGILDEKREKNIKSDKPDNSEETNKHTCVICSKSFSSNLLYKIHFGSHHSEKKMKIAENEKMEINTLSDEQFENSITGVKQNDNVRTRSIKKTKADKTPISNYGQKRRDKVYVCPGCPPERPLKFTHLKLYRAHIKLHPPTDFFQKETASNKCPNCLKVFRKMGSYKRHLRAHLDIHAYSCKHCLMKFLKKSQLLNHIKQQHQGKKKYSCALCSEKFYHRMGFAQHKTKHLSKPPYECPRCDASFSTITKRLRHLANHVLKCLFCREHFANDDQLWLHTNTVHRNATDCEFHCKSSDEENNEAVGKSFKHFLDIESDTDSYTSMESSSETEATSPIIKRSTNGYVCFICEHKFLKPESLHFHLKSHKVHFCRTCPKFFKTFPQLEMHQLKHVKKEPCLMSRSLIKSSDLETSTASHSNAVMTTDESSDDSVADQDLNSSSSGVANVHYYQNWLSNLKEIKKNLKYPLSDSMVEILNSGIKMLMSPKDEMTPEEQEIFNDLIAILKKNENYKDGKKLFD